VLCGYIMGCKHAKFVLQKTTWEALSDANLRAKEHFVNRR
jgi:hypothetical protein